MTPGPVMIMAGGTGGHVFPGLAIADALRARDCNVVWLGTRTGLEARVVPERGIPIEFISIGGVRGKRLLAWLAAPFRVAAAVVQALAIVRRIRPSVVLGMGGFVAGPGGIAAWLTRRPLLIHEQNAVAGTTNRLLSRIASRVFEAFPGSFGRAGAITTGNPVRPGITAVGRARRHDPADRRRHLFVFGGSQGAQALNETLPRAIAELDPAARPIVRHQAGRQAGQTRAAYAALGLDAEVTEFIEDMSSVYAWADLAVGRAGALTIAELAAAALGAILVPLPHAIDDHQRLNAEWFVRDGAGRIVPQAELTPERLARELADCLQPDRIAVMSAAAGARAMPHATEQLAAACLDARGVPA